MGFADEGRAYLSFGVRSPFLAISIAVHMVSAAFFDVAVLYQKLFAGGVERYRKSSNVS